MLIIRIVHNETIVGGASITDVDLVVRDPDEAALMATCERCDWEQTEERYFAGKGPNPYQGEASALFHAACREHLLKHAIADRNAT